MPLDLDLDPCTDGCFRGATLRRYSPCLIPIQSCARFYDLCSLPTALCSLLSALCSMRLLLWMIAPWICRLPLSPLIRDLECCVNDWSVLLASLRTDAGETSALYSLIYDLCAILSAQCPLLTAHCSLLTSLALCSMLYALCSMLYALCAMRYALGSMHVDLLS